MKEGWKSLTLSACIEKIQPTSKIPSSLYQKDGKYPIVSQEKEFISGYWDNAEDLFTHNIPVTIFGDHTTVVKYIDFNFIIGADGVKILLPKSFLHPKYFFYCVSSIKIASHGYARHYRYLKESIISYPTSLSEQQRIVEILDAEFAKIDALKANAEKSLQAAKDLFQSILKQELTPKDNWVHCELKDVCQFFNGKPHENNIDPNGEYILVNSKFIASDMRVYKKTGTQLFPLYKDDIVMVMSDVPKGQALAKCQIIDKDKTYSLNQRICVFRNSSINIHFLYYLINRNPYLLAFDNGENQTNLRKNDIITMPISYPKETSEMDDIIEKLDLMNERCKALQENYRKTIALCEDLKQALLRKAFNGEL